MALASLIILALLVEALAETSSLLVVHGEFQWKQLGIMAIGVLMAFMVNADLVKLLGFEEFIPYIGTIFTGLLLSRGSNFVHDLLKRVEK